MIEAFRLFCNPTACHQSLYFGDTPKQQNNSNTTLAYIILSDSIVGRPIGYSLKNLSLHIDKIFLARVKRILPVRNPDRPFGRWHLLPVT